MGWVNLHTYPLLARQGQKSISIIFPIDCHLPSRLSFGVKNAVVADVPTYTTRDTFSDKLRTNISTLDISHEMYFCHQKHHISLSVAITKENDHNRNITVISLPHCHFSLRRVSHSLLHKMGLRWNINTKLIFSLASRIQNYRYRCSKVNYFQIHQIKEIQIK